MMTRMTPVRITAEALKVLQIPEIRQRLIDSGSEIIGNSPEAADRFLKSEVERWGAVERQPLDGVRRKTAEQMARAWSLVPHVTQHELADVTDLEAARKRYAQSHASKSGGVKITMTVLAMKAVVTALKSFPRFNASYDPLVSMRTFVTHLEGGHVLKGCGHWTQQEAPEAVNTHLLDWLKGL